MNAPLAFIRELDNSLANSSGDRRTKMLRRLTDLFLVNADQYSEDQIALIDDVFVRIIEVIEESSRALLAIRLAPQRKAPPKTLRVLACDDKIDVASPVLIWSPRLDEPTLVECAKTKSQEHLLAISRRKMLTEAVTDILVERGDQQIVLSTVQNSGAKFSSKGFATLVKRSDGDDHLALCVGKRPDIPPQLLRQLLKAASESVRIKLGTERPSAKKLIDHVVTDVTAQIHVHAMARPLESATAQVLVNSLNVAGQLDSKKLEAFAKDGRLEEIVAALSLMSDTPVDFVERAMNDANGESLLVLCKAIGLSGVTTKSILTIGTHKHFRSAVEIERRLAAFNRLDQLTAQQILKFHKARAHSEMAQKM